MTIIENIAAHEKEIITGNIPDDLKACPKCNKTHNDFKLHDCKERIFLVTEIDVVHRIESFLGRWKCFFCGGTFINYPSFALPHKRYTVKDIVNFSSSYVSTHNITYQRVTQHEGLGIGYGGKEAHEKGRQLAGSTIWRWISFLGSLCLTVQSWFHCILQRNFAFDIARRLYPVSSKKYKSPERKILLQQCLRLIWHVVFPQFAIRDSVN